MGVTSNDDSGELFSQRIDKTLETYRALNISDDNDTDDDSVALVGTTSTTRPGRTSLTAIEIDSKSGDSSDSDVTLEPSPQAVHSSSVITPTASTTTPAKQPQDTIAIDILDSSDDDDADDSEKKSASSKSASKNDSKKASTTSSGDQLQDSSTDGDDANDDEKNTVSSSKKKASPTTENTDTLSPTTKNTKATSKTTPKKRGRMKKSDSDSDSNSDNQNPKPKKRRKKPVKWEEPEIELVDFKNETLQVGHPVYAPFPGKDPWQESYYWGLITEKIKVSNDKHNYLFSVAFSDGDVLEQPISSEFIHRLPEAYHLFEIGRLDFPQHAPEDYIKKWDEAIDGQLPKTLAARYKMEGASANENDQPVPPETTSAASATATGLVQGAVPLTLRELYEQQCGNCSQCTTRPACGLCISCLYNSRPENSTHPKCCLQKMCSKIPVSQKGQSCELLPKGWAFYFREADSNPEVKGLWISRGQRRFRSYRWACKGAKKQFSSYAHLESSFMQFVGLKDRIQSPSRSSSSGRHSTADEFPAMDCSSIESSRAVPKPLSPAQMEEERCGKCRRCTLPRCKQCFLCTAEETVHLTKNSCIRKICTRLEGIDTFQKSKYLPVGWRFYFADKSSREGVYTKLDGLIIVGPNGLRYNSFESAARQNNRVFRGSYTVEEFYSSLGIELTTADVKELGRLKKPPTSVSDSSKRSEDSEDLPSVIAINSTTAGLQEYVARESGRVSAHGDPLSAVALYRRRCRKCPMCTKPACGKCESCKWNTSKSQRTRKVCFRKMCRTFDYSEKCQPVKYLVPGWSFFFEMGNDPEQEYQDLQGLALVSPQGHVMKDVLLNIQQMLAGVKDDMDRKEAFFKHIGAKLREPVESPEDRLMGLPISYEWVRLNGTKVYLTGVIGKVELNVALEQAVYTVKFDEESREVVNETASSTAHVPSELEIGFHEAWSGCMKCDEYLDPPERKLMANVPFHNRWKTPDTYQQRLLPSGSNDPSIPRELPCLLLTYKGFMLTFRAKKSSIENSGCGVFLSVRPAFKIIQENKFFQLGCGELLDIGIYAPFRDSDCRRDTEHVIKSIIHKCKNETYCFTCRDTEDYYFDITDDFTADLHSDARKHIPPYVNEVFDPTHDTPTIHSRFDPEGCLHYLLGHENASDGPFVVPADGSEVELFIDYGHHYENVRLREGYARQPMDPEKAKSFLSKEEREYLAEIENFSVNELDTTRRSLKSDVERIHKPSESWIVRMLIVACCLENRSKGIYEDFRDLGDDESFCDNGVRELDLDGLIKDCRLLIGSICSLWHEKIGNYSDLHRAAQESELFRHMFSKFFSRLNLAEISPEKLPGILSHQMEMML